MKDIGNPTKTFSFINTSSEIIPRIFIQIKSWISIPYTGELKEVVTILDTGSGVNLVNENLAYDWGLPLLATQNKIIFPNQEEDTSRVTQELNVSIKLPSTKGEIIEKKERLRFTLSKNIPYGCLLGIYSLFDLKIGFKVTNKGYRPYFDEEEITTLDSSLLLEDPTYSLIIKALNGDDSVKKQINKYDLSKFTIKEGILLFNGLICVPFSLRKEILSLHHDYTTAGHLGIEKTAELISRNFYWTAWMKDVENYVKSCKVCSSMKASRHKTYGEMIPLEIPNCPWKVVEIDFITNVPSRNCEFSIMVSCDKLTKMVHLFAFPGVPTANEAAIGFLKSVFYLHGLPNEIITDRGSQFTSEMWKEIMDILSIKHRTATTGHHTTVGQVERLNQSVEQFIRCFLRAHPSEDWIDWLYLIEFIYNNSKNSSTGQPPFLAFNGFLPSFSPENVSVSTTFKNVHHIPDFTANIEKIKHVLAASQELYKRYADLRRATPPKFKIGDLVWLKRPSNFIPNGSTKLCPRKYGPFKIIEVLKFNNYRLNLSNSPFPRKYNIFNICELEPFIKRKKDFSDNTHSPEIHTILNCRINPDNNNCEYLVSYIEPGFPDKWVNSSIVDEDDYYSEILAQFNNITNNCPI